MTGSGRPSTMIVAGVMSGTSADGVDVAVCRIGPGRTVSDSPKVSLIGLASFHYVKPLRDQVLKIMGGANTTAAELSRLSWRLGEVYADCVQRAASRFGVKMALVGCHGQTVHHDSRGARLLGTRVRSTSQIGEAAVIAERIRCPVVSDFRPADLTAGGQGAPLVPMLDWCMLRSAKINRVLQNLGGIGNLTAMPAGCGSDQVMAFDTGPGNMVVDQCAAVLFGKKFDRDGAIAKQGKVLERVIVRVLRQPYFSTLPPKSCGREEFGVDFAQRFISMCRDAGGTSQDCVATATALTAESVVDAYRRFVSGHMSRFADAAPVEFVVAGGGAKNRVLMELIRERFGEMQVRARTSEELGVPAQAKEGMAFALLAWLTWHGLPGNVPAATGAREAVVLGKISRA